MGIFEFVLLKSPGEVKENNDYIAIEHFDGDISIFYKAKNKNYSFDLPDQLGTIYEHFDGINLFSSTFMFSPINNPTIYDGVEVFNSIETLQYQMEDISFPEKSLSFLNETGNFIYSAPYGSTSIFSFDIESGELEIHKSVYEIISNWIDVVKA